ncbi:hypothetical protein [Hylemonella gracilis]|nr:hypothetical protein [Hylemonella gracilis]
MFVEAHELYSSATREIDYIVSIVLSGAVLGIVSPLLKEQGGHTAHSLLARIADHIAKPEEPSTHEGVFRATYNAFKHAGHESRKIAPSSDLEIQTELRREAAHMLNAAKEDFRQIKDFPYVNKHLSQQFFELIDSDEGYA